MRSVVLWTQAARESQSLLRTCHNSPIAWWQVQVPEDEAVLYNRDKVRRPVPEEKAINKAAEMIRVIVHLDSCSWLACMSVCSHSSSSWSQVCTR